MTQLTMKTGSLFIVEHIFIAIQTDESREDDYEVINIATTGLKKEEKGGEKCEDEKEGEIFGFRKFLDTYLGDVMRVKWTTGNKQIMRRLVDENETESEATNIWITTRSREDAWNRAQIMKTAWRNNEQD